MSEIAENKVWTATDNEEIIERYRRHNPARGPFKLPDTEFDVTGTIKNISKYSSCYGLSLSIDENDRHRVRLYGLTQEEAIALDIGSEYRFSGRVVDASGLAVEFEKIPNKELRILRS